MEHARIEVSAKGHLRFADVTMVALIAALPVILGLTTWLPGSGGDGRSLAGFFPIAVMAIEIATLVYAIILGVDPLRPVGAAPRRMQIALAALLAIAFSTALLVAPDRPSAVVRTMYSVTHLLFGLAVARLMASRCAELRPLLWPAMIAGTCVFTLLAAFYVVSLSDSADFDWLRFEFGVTNVRQLGNYAAVGTAAALGLVAARPGKRVYALGVGAASFLLALSFWSGSRGSLTALAAAFVIGLIANAGFRSVRMISATALSFALGGLASLAHIPPHPSYGLFRMWFSVGGGSVDEVSSGRLSIWKATVEAILDRPIFGYGEGQLHAVVPDLLGGHIQPHSFPLQLLMQWGVAGTICFLALALPLARRFDQKARICFEDAAPAFLVGVTLLIFSLYDGTLFHPYPVSMMVLSVAFVLSARQPELASKASNPWESRN